MEENPMPASLPEPVEKHPLAINIYFIVVAAIAAGFLLIVLGALVLTAQGKEIPDTLSNLGMASLVALSAMLNGSKQN